MKIQEMRSGIPHLSKKLEVVRRENVLNFQGQPVVEAPPVCELDEPRWSVVSFDKREAGSLRYAEAAGLMSILDARGVAGLCVVTDEAANRLSR